jgi:hypothetical protein
MLRSKLVASSLDIFGGVVAPAAPSVAAKPRLVARFAALAALASMRFSPS